MPLLYSLRGRLALVILLSSLLTLTTVSLLAYQNLAKDLEAELTRQQTSQTRQLAGQIEAELTLRLLALGSLARELSDGNRLVDTAAIERSLPNRRQLEALFPSAIVVLDAFATAIAENRHVPGRLGTNYADRRHFQQLLRTGEPVVSQPIIGRTTGRPLISFLHPITNTAGQLIGIVSGTVDLSETSVISDASLDTLDDEGLQILDSAHFYYVQGNPDQQGLNITELPDPGVNPLIDRALQGISSGTITLADGSRQLYATAIVPSLNWIVLKANPVGEILAPAQASFRNFLVISIGLCLLLALLGFWAVRRAMTPLNQLTVQIQRMVQQPELDQSLPVSGIEEIRDLTTAFNALTEERHRLNQIKDEFVATVSHELRTPLTSLNGALGLLNGGASGELPAQSQELIRLALRNGTRLQALIQDLLDFNKLQAGRMTFEMRRCQPGPLLQACIEHNLAMAKHFQVQLELDCRDVCDIRVDASRLQQIIDNYLSNAIKHAPARSRVRVATQCRDGGLVITVSDQGAGVPAHFIDQLFTRFAQAEIGTTRAISGTGLGLAICREIADHMGGQVGYFENEGAHFWVTFPAISKPSQE
ncbi:MAG: ATP-binding protein [Saccharospirillum sp.]